MNNLGKKPIWAGTIMRATFKMLLDLPAESNRIEIQKMIKLPIVFDEYRVVKESKGKKYGPACSHTS